MTPERAKAIIEHNGGTFSDDTAICGKFHIMFDDNRIGHGAVAPDMLASLDDDFFNRLGYAMP